MSGPSKDQPNRADIRTKIMGLGERAGRKSYYPQLQARILELEDKSSTLAAMLEELDGARRRAEESEQRFRVLFEHIVDGILVADLESQRIVLGNESISRILGCPQQELPGLLLADIHRPIDFSLILAMSQEPAPGKPQAPLEVPVKRRDGDVCWVELRSSSLSLDGRPCLMVIYRDVTGRRIVEDDLRRSELRFRELAELLPQTVFEADLAGRVTFANQIAFEMFGYAPEDIQQGFDCMDTLIPEDRDRARANMARTLQGEDLSGQEYTALRKDGGTFPCIVYATAIRDETGVSGLRGIVVDITDQERLREQKDLIEEQYNQAQKMEAIGQLAGGVAHDLNNLLCPVLGYTEMLLYQFSPDDARRRSVEEIHQAGLKARELVHQLLAFSRKQALEVEVVDLNRVISGFQPLLRRMLREDIEVLTILSPSITSIRADVGQIEQVILNLAINAQDAMAHGGKIVVETGMANLDEAYAVEHHGVQPGAYVMLAVSDTGHGMDPRTRERIFDPFFTTKEKGKGTGLGLATVYGIVKQHGGNIWAYSEPGEGSTFKVYLPAAFERAVDRSQPLPLPENSIGGETVLLAEDSEIVRNLAMKILERLGYRVLSGANGTECLRLLADYDGPLYLLITDVVMPDMNGKVLFERVSALRPTIKVLYMSGYTDNMIAQHGLLEEGVAFMQKPFTVQSMGAKVRQVLNQGERARCGASTT